MIIDDLFVLDTESFVLNIEPILDTESTVNTGSTVDTESIVLNTESVIDTQSVVADI